MRHHGRRNGYPFRSEDWSGAGHGSRVGGVLLCLLLVTGPVSAGLHMDRHKEIRKGPKMDITAATFFGTESAEEFVGVTETPDGRILVAGNSWGPPFPGGVETKVWGADGSWKVPLCPPGMDKDRKGRAMRPPDTNPNRTGFLVLYSSDLRKIERQMRFGWGVAAVSSVGTMSDGSIIVAGRGTKLFAAVAGRVKLNKTHPRGASSAFGPVEYEGDMQPGDCFIAKLTPKLDGFEWIWTLEAHRTPPKRLLAGPKGMVAFECRRLMSISADGNELREWMKPPPGEQKVLGASPDGRYVLIGGQTDSEKGTGREPWRQPVLGLYTPDGTHYSKFYDWDGRVVGHDSFRLVANTEVRAGCFLPNGDILIALRSRGRNTVAARNPVDLRIKIAANGGAEPKPKRGRRRIVTPSIMHLVRFSTSDYADCSHTTLSSCTQTRMEAVRVQRIRGAGDGTIMVTGEAPAFLPQTTTRWYRDTDHYHWEGDWRQEGGGITVTTNGWPSYIGVGGRGSFSAVFSPGFEHVLWASAIALCEHADICHTKRGVVAVSVNTGHDAKDGRTPVFMAHDVGNWSKFIMALRKEAVKPGETPGKRIWTFLSDGLKDKMLLMDPEAKEVPFEVKKRLFFEFNKILIDFPNFYDEKHWKKCRFNEFEKKLIAMAESGKMEKKLLMELNRRLLEKGFPKHIFRCPKSNCAPVLNAAQSKFGGGFSDGHVYLLEKCR